MNQLYVEANKSFRHGFILPESELRRFTELIREQVKKINADPDLSFRYQLKFQNGVVAETDSIDSILSQENEGSRKIVSLHIYGKDQKDNSISIEFHNIESDNVDIEHSVRYNIKSRDRDWVFVTSSQIEERIAKIKRFDFLPRSKSSTRLFSLFIPLLLTIVMLISLLSSITNRDNYLVKVKESYAKGEIKNTDQLIFLIEEAKQKQSENLNLVQVFSLPGIIVGGLVVIGVLIYLYLWKLYPLYNFCWGDYLEVFKRKETTRKTFNTVVIWGLVISIIGGVITNLIKF
jgi:hypothetical protein